MPQSTTPDRIAQASSLDLTLAVRARVREAIEAVLDEELAAVLGCGASERSPERAGYRHGALTRDVLTEHGPTPLTIPRALLFGEGATLEWRSSLLPRYQRRTRAVDAAVLGAYLAGGNTRRLRKALAPLLGDANLSRSAISWIVGRLRTLFAARQSAI